MFNEDMGPMGFHLTVVVHTLVDKHNIDGAPVGVQQGLKTLQRLSWCELLGALESTDSQLWMFTSKL